MNVRCLWLLLGLSILPHPGRADTGSLKPNDLVMITGDSITEQRRYSVFIQDYLMMCEPVADLKAMNMGWNGETAFAFQSRQEHDTSAFHPTVATICLGMNDGGTDPITSDLEDRYRTSLDTVVKTYKKEGVRWVVVGSPGVVDIDTHKKSDPLVRNANLAKLKGIAEEVAKQNDSGFADVHDVMWDVMTKAKEKYGHGYEVAGPDGVHPSNNGHLVMAYAFLKALHCKGDIGTITYDMKTDTAESTAGHKMLSVAKGTMELESTRYPFCFSGDPAAPMSTTRIIEFFPFNDDLNRFLLVVKNAPTAKVSVTFGKDTKQFDAAALEKGVNLAAEFMDNPFSQSFANADQKIRDQQDFDVVSVKLLLHSLVAWQQYFPEFAETYKDQTSGLLKKIQGLREKARAAVVPVKYQIVVQPVS